MDSICVWSVLVWCMIQTVNVPLNETEQRNYVMYVNLHTYRIHVVTVLSLSHWIGLARAAKFRKKIMKPSKIEVQIKKRKHFCDGNRDKESTVISHRVTKSY